MTDNPERFTTSPEAELKRVQRLEKKQRKLQASHFSPIRDALTAYNGVGLVLLGDSKMDTVRRGYKATYPEERLLTLDWDLVSDPKTDSYDSAIVAATQGLMDLRRQPSPNEGVVVIEGVDFSRHTTPPYNALGQKLFEMIARKRATPLVRPDQPAVLAVGHGNIDSVRPHPDFFLPAVKPEKYDDFLYALGIRFGLRPDGTFLPWRAAGRENEMGESPLDDAGMPIHADYRRP